MAVKYQTLPENNFSGGIDARSAENDIPDGYAEDILNGEVIETRTRKRKGVQGYAGNIPARVTSLDHSTGSTDNLLLTLGSGVDLSSLTSSPLVVYGRTSTAPTPNTDFTTTDSVHYYPGWSTRIRKLFPALSTTTVSIPASEHALGSNKLFVGVTQSSNIVNTDYTSALPDVVSIDKTTYAVGVTQTNNTASDIRSFIFYADENTVLGSTYNHSFSFTSGPTAHTEPVAASTHGLTNFDIVARLYRDAGGVYTQVTPDSLTISPTGTVTVTLTDDSNTIPATVTYSLVLVAADSTNILTQMGVGPSTAATVTLLNVTSPWVFLGVYTQSGGVLTEIIPDSYTYSSATQDLTISLNLISAVDIVVYYTYGAVRSNQLVLDATVGALGSTTFSDTRPQLTVWGLDHNEIYGDSRDGREGWTTHIDSLRRSGEQRLVSGLGGNLYTSRSYTESGSSYAYPVLYPSLQGRLAAGQVVGPLLSDTGETPGRTRGFLTHNGGSQHLSVVTSVVYDSVTGYTKYTLDLPGKSSFNSSNVATSVTALMAASPPLIYTGANYADQLTITDGSWDVHNGVYNIRAVTDAASSLIIWVDNEAITSSDYDDMNCGAYAGVFTDEIILATGISTFTAGDQITSTGNIPDTSLLRVVATGTSATSLMVSGADANLTLPLGLKVVGTRTSAVMPLRDAASVPANSVINLVRGDMLSLTGISRLLRVKYVNSDTSRAISITGDGTTATITFSAGDTTYLAVGGIIQIDAGVYSGTQTITGISSNLLATFSSSHTGTTTGTLLGNTVQLDEELEWSDTLSSTTSLSVGTRWIPVEAPDDTWALTPSTYVSHLDANAYGNQPFLRSVMVSDNMYLTNGADEVMKLDGTSLYRAGLIPWQPGCIMTQDTTATSKIVIDTTQVPISSKTANTTTEFQVALGSQSTFTVGQRVHFFPGTGGSPAGEGDYTVTEVHASSTAGFVRLGSGNTTLTLGTAGFYLQGLSTFHYYFRLNAVDENDNVVVSAITGAQDHVMELSSSAAVYIKLVGIPAWDNYDYDKLEVQIYRTKANVSAPFYLITTLQMKFAGRDGYVEFTDPFADSNLLSLDPVSSALLGQELGTGWSEPLRAKYITTAGNSLILANLKDYPQLDIQIVGDDTLTVADYAGKVLTLRKDSTTSLTITDMLTTARYEWRIDSSGQNTSAAASVVGTSFTFTVPAGAPITGDWVYLYHRSNTVRPLTYAGWWQIRSVTGVGPYVVTVFSASATASVTNFPDRAILATVSKDIPVLLGSSAGYDNNMGMLNGNSAFITFQAMRKMAMAINASMRLVDTGAAGYTTFTPWIVARAGNEFKAGQLILRKPRIDDATVPSVLLPTTLSPLQFFVNEVRRSDAAAVVSSTRIYPSRVMISYPNYAELFDKPTVVVDTDSDSVVDVNPADGQEITGLIPFFGDSAFGAAQQSGIVVAFKENSIYLIDIAAKRAGTNPLQKLETQGLGCTAPYSIAHTKNGIVFANESGIYSLGRNLQITYLGLKMERNWLGNVRRSLLSIAQGHHYSVGRQYKLSLPIGDEATENSEAYVYDHSKEDAAGGQTGAWTRFDATSATGWANLAQDAFYATHTGRVFSLRRIGDNTDYRDDSQAINWVVTTRAIHGGAPGIRKIFDRVISLWRSDATSSSTILEACIDLGTTFTETTSFRMPNSATSDGLSDPGNKKIIELRHSLPDRRGAFLQLRITNDAIDERVELAGLQISAAAISDRGLINAKDAGK